MTSSVPFCTEEVGALEQSGGFASAAGRRRSPPSARTLGTASDASTRRRGSLSAQVRRRPVTGGVGKRWGTGTRRAIEDFSEMAFSLRKRGGRYWDRTSDLFRVSLENGVHRGSIQCVGAGQEGVRSRTDGGGLGWTRRRWGTRWGTPSGRVRTRRRTSRLTKSMSAGAFSRQRERSKDTPVCSRVAGGGGTGQVGVSGC